MARGAKMLDTFISVIPALYLLAQIWVPILLIGGIAGAFFAK